MELEKWLLEAIIVICVGFIIAIGICWLFGECINCNKSDWDK